MPEYLSEPGHGAGSGIKVLIVTLQNPKPWDTSSPTAVMQREVLGAAHPGCAVQLLWGCSPEESSLQGSGGLPYMQDSPDILHLTVTYRQIWRLLCVCLRFPNVWQPVRSCQMSRDTDLAH